MASDRDLVRALVRSASNYREKAPVLEVAHRPAADVAQEAVGTVAKLWAWFRDCSIRPDVVAEDITVFRIPEQGAVRVFHPSGAIAAEWRGARDRGPIAQNEKSADVAGLTAETERVARMIAQRALSERDELRFERLWKIKASGITLRGERAPVSLFEVVGAYRRYLEGLPVLGRASVFVTLGAKSQVTQWGIDWRRLRTKPLAQTPVINPEEGAKRIMDDLFARRPEKPFTLDDFEPASFTLGYVSYGKRQVQFVMQPAWVAVLRPRGRTTMGQVVAVPAAPRAFEPFAVPPITSLPPARGAPAGKSR